MTDKPAFEVHAGDRVFKVYANGMTDGFGDGPIVVNRIPALVGQAAHNAMILERMRGLKPQQGTPETDADPCNPNASETAHER
jgi:hypothetical protein